MFYKTPEDQEHRINFPPLRATSTTHVREKSVLCSVCRVLCRQHRWWVLAPRVHRRGMRTTHARGEVLEKFLQTRRTTLQQQIFGANLNFDFVNFFTCCGVAFTAEQHSSAGVDLRLSWVNRVSATTETRRANDDE